MHCMVHVMHVYVFVGLSQGQVVVEKNTHRALHDTTDPDILSQTDNYPTLVRSVDVYNVNDYSCIFSLRFLHAL